MGKKSTEKWRKGKEREKRAERMFWSCLCGLDRELKQNPWKIISVPLPLTPMSRLRLQVSLLYMAAGSSSAVIWKSCRADSLSQLHFS